MAQLILSNLALEIPGSWKDQAMITLTLPSTDKKIRPNVILTKETLGQPVSLEDYYAKVKQAILKRNVKSFEILSETPMSVAGIPAMQMICRWDLSALQGTAAGTAAAQSGQMVQQVQLTLIHQEQAINFTASFPEDQFDLYMRPFEKFVATLKFI